MRVRVPVTDSDLRSRGAPAVPATDDWAPTGDRICAGEQLRVEPAIAAHGERAFVAQGVDDEHGSRNRRSGRRASHYVQIPSNGSTSDAWSATCTRPRGGRRRVRG